jgi:cytoskeletal protein CcmA (bactofilin family)
MRHALVALLLAAASRPAPAADTPKGAGPGAVLEDGDAKEPCRLTMGPRDRVAQDADLVLEAGADVESAVALRGSVVVRRGARVKKVLAAAGSVRVEAGGVVTDDVVVLSGDVKVAPGGRIEGDVVALGGRVQVAEGATVVGNVVALSLQLADLDLEKELRKRIGAAGACRVEQEERPR